MSHKFKYKIFQPISSAASDKIVLVFIPGYRSTITAFNEVIKILQKFGIVLAADLIGHGQNKDYPFQYINANPQDWAYEYIKSIKTILQNNFKNHKIIIVGASLGGTIACHMAYYLKPQNLVHGLVLLSTILDINLYHKKYRYDKFSWLLKSMASNNIIGRIIMSLAHTPLWLLKIIFFYFLNNKTLNWQDIKIEYKIFRQIEPYAILMSGLYILNVNISTFIKRHLQFIPTLLLENTQETLYSYKNNLQIAKKIFKNLQIITFKYTYHTPNVKDFINNIDFTQIESWINNL